ncbi:hypothetical protein Tsubulata_043646 [Turnera subulata]|uniref:Uncharacterized protein n=1 Tax=Turnera subulata TaxID=218843 RepID=A0A9Q0FH97_9ROSI|nr:hypothetical protein Tsubulata_043646 [Turnera subulata]
MSASSSSDAITGGNNSSSSAAAAAAEIEPAWRKCSEEDLAKGVQLDKDWRMLTNGEPFTGEVLKRFKQSHEPQLRRMLTRCGYYKEIRKSMGFEVSEPPIKDDGTLIYPTDPNRNDVKLCALFAVAHIGVIKKRKQELVEVVRANAHQSWGFMFYLTFTARDKASTEKPQTFQAMIFFEEPNGDYYHVTPFYIRLKPSDK